MRSPLCIAFCFVTLLVGASLGYSQKVQEGVGSNSEIRLPRPFSEFSNDDIYSAVFLDFDKATGRVPGIPNEQKQPSLVRLNQARLWRSGGKDFLVVMLDIGGYDEQFGISGLCGICSSTSPIAVLRLDGKHLELVAKQENDFYSSEDGEDHSTSFESFSFTGHDFDVSFDLAPYRLNEAEMLIGVRYQYMWIPASSYATTLLLYRIEGTRIRKVFEDLVVDRAWTNSPKRRLPMEKTVATISMIPTAGSFNRLVETKKTYKCFADWEEMDCKGGRLYKTDQEIWKFDDSVFVTIRKQEN